MIEIQVKFNNIEYSLRILKKKLQKEGIFKVIKEKRYYEKPSEKKTKRKVKIKNKTYQAKEYNNKSPDYNLY